MSTIERQTRLETAQTVVVFHAQFFALGVARLPIVWSESVPTAATDGKEILWNPSFFDSLSDGELVTVLCHEVAHCLLGHVWRMPEGGIPLIWNLAIDWVVNGMLDEFGQFRVKQGKSNPFPMPSHALLDPKYLGMAEEVIYDSLPKPQNGSGTVFIQSGSQSTHGTGKRPKSGSGAGLERSMGEVIPQSGQADKKSKQDWEGVLIQSVQAAKQFGFVPGALERYAGTLVAPKVPWYELLRNWLREQCQDDWDFMKPNQYYSDSKFILPSLHSERMGTIVFGKDTSGSIDDKLLTQFVSEQQTCLDELKPNLLLDLCFDAEIQSQVEYRPGDRISKEAKGGGGTSFVSVTNHCNNLPEQPKCLIVLTDLCGEFPDHAPSYPVLWVVWGGETKAPFGQVVNVE